MRERRTHTLFALPEGGVAPGERGVVGEGRKEWGERRGKIKSKVKEEKKGNG